MDKFGKLLAKKKAAGHELSPHERDAKMSVVKHLQDFAGGEMAKKLDGLKKVSVMSDSDEGLKHGMDKAKELVGHMADKEESHEDPMEEAAETPEQEMQEEVSGIGENEGEESGASDHDGLEADSRHEGDDHKGHEDASEEELDAKIAHLMSLKNKKRK